MGTGATEAVVGIFDREHLSRALVATHRAGFGANARVLDSSRGDLAGQLLRSGFSHPIQAEELGGSTALILVSAPGRAAAAAQTFTLAGARAVHVLQRGAGPASPQTVDTDAAVPPVLELSFPTGDELGA